MSNKWTDEQKLAFNSLDGSLIVSAAAGSGKTAVLVERIINLICNSNKPVPVDRLLVVTFTRAAASEMRTRLMDALDKRISAEPENKYIQRQQMMLPLADICTIDQFLNNLVKDNFHQLAITPDYRILDDSEIKLLSAESVDEVLDEFYEDGSEEFMKLLDLFGCDKRDEDLIDSIVKLNDYSSAYPHPNKWLENIVKSYDGDALPQNTVFGEIILKKIADYAEYAKQLITSAKAITQSVPELDGITVILSSDGIQVDKITDLCKTKRWNELIVCLDNLVFERFPTIKGEYKDSFEKKYSQALRNREKDIVKSLEGVIPANEDEFKNDISLLKPVIQKLIEVVFAYKQRFSDKKREENSFDFNDIEHLALSVLIDENNQPTAMAKELQKKYDEILIDEYQDTNEAQDAIFCALSDNMSNLFLVGDVKQSIYRFRLAMPQVFLSRMKEWKSAKTEYPMCINLDKNFRSRPQILEGVNFFFRRVMSERTGDMVYDDNEALKAGADYPQSDIPQVEMCVLDEKMLPEEYDEAQYIADRIDEILRTKTQVYDKEAEALRDVTYRDICVLLRTKKIGSQVALELKDKGIPAFFEDNKGFFDNTEITVMLSLLCIIDNPVQDVPLMSVMMSPLFGFSADDVAEIRIHEPKKSLYYAVKESENEKCLSFIENYNEIRRLSTVMSVSSLIRTIYDNTGYLSIVSALSNGDVRKLNLMLLLEYAVDYEQYGKTGLSGFIRYIERIKKTEGDLKPASGASEYSDVVRIMTVHKSKGLEFPIVFLSDCGRRKRDFSGNLVVHENTGVGVKVFDKKNFKKYNTVQYEATKTACTLSDCSEELRILYVAMTRARERLIMTASVSDVEKEAVNASADCALDSVNSVAVEKSTTIISLLMKGFMRHPDAAILRGTAGYCGEYDVSSDFKMKFEIIDTVKSISEEETESEKEKPVNNELLAEIKDRTQFRYKYEPLAFCAAKRAASAFNSDENDFEFFAYDTPQFTKQDNISGAGRGTAMHRFMEVCDFSRAVSDISAEASRLVLNGKISLEQANVLDLKALNGFFCGKLFARIQKSEKVYREQKFTIEIPVSQAQPDIDSEFFYEKVLVQGVIDCAFTENGKLTVVDYKTDKVKSADELRARYHRQLEIYKLAAQEALETEVDEILLYSFYLGEDIEIKL